MIPVEPTLTDIVAMAGDLAYCEAITARTAVDLVATLVPLTPCRAARLIVADAERRATQIQTIHIDDGEE